MGHSYKINDFFVTNNCKKNKFKKIMKKKNFLLGPLTFFKVIRTVIFKKMRWKNILKMAMVLDLIPLYKRRFTS